MNAVLSVPLFLPAYFSGPASLLSPADATVVVPPAFVPGNTLVWAAPEPGTHWAAPEPGHSWKAAPR